MASLPDVIRSGLREEDLTDLPPEIRKGLEPLLRYVNNAVQGFTAAFSGQIDSKNVQCEVQTVNLSHGVPQTISLKRLTQAKGIDCISVGSADGKTRHALSIPVVMTGTTTPNSVRVTAYFADPSAVRVPVTIRLWPDGQYSAIAPSIDTAWAVPTFQNSWADLGSSVPVGYMKDALGRVWLRGQAKSGTFNATIFTLPTGYRPTNNVYYAADASGAYGRVTIGSNGNVVQDKGAAAPTNLQLDGISFDTRS